MTSDIEICDLFTIHNPRESLLPVLISAIRNPPTDEVAMDEITEVLAAILSYRNQPSQGYCVVAKQPGSQVLLGVMTLKPPDKIIRGFARSENPIELTDAYVLTRRTGIGRALVAHMENKARADGHTEIVLVSGPRFRWSGWPFWRRLYGRPVGIAERYFNDAEGEYDGSVWRKPLK
ncbi:hypothetical protein HJC99_05325 [Candidatus Saccharibacteria bacterium]|nr:hypothetical protein [Candidatus Saccharibacteria bacterium]